MPSDQPDVLTVTELAAYLKVPKSTVYKLAQEGRVPAQKVGRHWRFRREAIDCWLEEAPPGFSSERQDGSAAK